MSVAPDEASAAGGLKKRHVAQLSSSRINPGISMDPVAGNGSDHVGKEKKTFGRTPDGTGELHKSPGEE